jgi:hypothetical protein
MKTNVKLTKNPLFAGALLAFGYSVDIAVTGPKPSKRYI